MTYTECVAAGRASFVAGQPNQPPPELTVDQKSMWRAGWVLELNKSKRQSLST